MFLCGILSLAITFNVFKPLLAFVIILDIFALPLSVLLKNMPRYCLLELSPLHCLTIDIDIWHLGFHGIVVQKTLHNLRFLWVYSTIFFTSFFNSIDILLNTISSRLFVSSCAVCKAFVCKIICPASFLKLVCLLYIYTLNSTGDRAERWGKPGLIAHAFDAHVRC